MDDLKERNQRPKNSRDNLANEVHSYECSLCERCPVERDIFWNAHEERRELHGCKSTSKLGSYKNKMP
jgi:hypothetical protein